MPEMVHWAFHTIQFTGADWRLEDDKACLLQPNYQRGDTHILRANGVQVWRNRRL